jgi:AcrR family transcriptional regulator
MRCVADVGYSRTIREIARAAQMTSGSLYHYFPNKAELVRATFDEVATIAVPRLAQAAERNVSTIDKLMAVLDESVRVMRDSSARWPSTGPSAPRARGICSWPRTAMCDSWRCTA